MAGVCTAATCMASVCHVCLVAARAYVVGYVFRRMPTPAVCHMYTDDIRLLLCSHMYFGGIRAWT